MKRILESKKALAIFCSFVFVAFLTTGIIKTSYALPNVSTPKFKELYASDYSEVTVAFKRIGKTSGVQVYNTTTKQSVRTTRTSNYTWKSLKPGNIYNFKIRSYYKTGGKTYYSKWTSLKRVQIPSLFRVDFLSLTVTNSLSIRLGYEPLPLFHPPTGVQIYNTETNKYIRTTNLSAYTFTNLESGKTYNFKIRAYHRTKNGKYYYGPWSDYKNAIARGYKVNTPKFTSISRAEYNKIKLGYKTSGNVTGIQIYNMTTKKYVKSTNKTSTIIGATYNKTQKFKIRSYYTLNGITSYSNWSNTKTITPKLSTPYDYSLRWACTNYVNIYYSSRSKYKGIQVYNATTKKTKSYANTSGKIKYKGLKKGRKYKIKIRSYYKVGKKTYYSNWTSYKTVKLSGDCIDDRYDEYF